MKPRREELFGSVFENEQYGVWWIRIIINNGSCRSRITWTFLWQFKKYIVKEVENLYKHWTFFLNLWIRTRSINYKKNTPGSTTLVFTFHIASVPIQEMWTTGTSVCVIPVPTFEQKSRSSKVNIDLFSDTKFTKDPHIGWMVRLTLSL